MKLNIPIKIYSSFFSKFRGLMFQKRIDYGIKLVSCNSVHTFFMKNDIDLVITDKNDIVVFIKENLHPNKIILPKKEGKSVYELPVGSIKKNKIKLNIKIED